MAHSSLSSLESIAKLCCYRAIVLLMIMTSSVSFRITRTAEDLAQAITALSQRLVKMEQRQESLQLQWRQFQEQNQDISADEQSRLDGVDQLLRECQELLISSDQDEDQQKAEESVEEHDSAQIWSEEETNLAA